MKNSTRRHTALKLQPAWPPLSRDLNPRWRVSIRDRLWTVACADDAFIATVRDPQHTLSLRHFLSTIMGKDPFRICPCPGLLHVLPRLGWINERFLTPDDDRSAGQPTRSGFAWMKASERAFGRTYSMGLAYFPAM